MVRTPCCKAELGLKKGAWTPEEDQKLLSYLDRHGEGGWRTLPEKAGILFYFFVPSFLNIQCWTFFVFFLNYCSIIIS